MPPVAETFKQAVERLLGKRSMRDLARRLAEMDPGKQTSESWRRSLNRYDKRYPDEDSAKLIARALDVPRTQLPRQPTVLEMFQQVDGRLEAVEGQVGDLATKAELEDALEILRVAIQNVATLGSRSKKANGE